jgi:hypothetical protein
METTTQALGVEEIPATPGSAAKRIRSRDAPRNPLLNRHKYHSHFIGPEPYAPLSIFTTSPSIIVST